MNTFDHTNFGKLIQLLQNNIPNFNSELLGQYLRILDTHLYVKETEQTMLIYYNEHNDMPATVDQNIDYKLDDNFKLSVLDELKSIMIDKQTLKPLYTQYNRIIYNDDGMKYVQDNNIDFKNVVVQESYEGTMLTVYYHGKWNVSTRRCIDAYQSTWVKNKSFGDLFDDIIKSKFESTEVFFNILDKNYCYHFILVHHMNNNITNYDKKMNVDQFKELYHVLTTELYTLNEVMFPINGISVIENKNYNNINDLVLDLNNIGNNDMINKSVTTEGYVLRVYQGEIYKSPFVIIKLQTELYKELKKTRPNNNNMYCWFLELFCKNKLNETIIYFPKYNNNIAHKINTSLNTIADEILNLYFLTRKQNNKDVYDNLSKQYKQILYDLHGIYMNNKSNRQYNININKGTVYHVIKSMEPKSLIQLYYDRSKLIKDPINNIFINHNCMETSEQTRLMFE